MTDTVITATLTPAQIKGATVVDFACLAWERSLQWETGSITDWPTFVAVVHTLNLRHGAFHHDLLDALEPVFPKLSGIAVARECSECLYAYVPKWTHQAAGEAARDGRPLTLGEMRAAAADFITAVRTCRPDELHVLAHKTTPGLPPEAVPPMGDPVDVDLSDGQVLLGAVTPYRIRAWWD